MRRGFSLVERLVVIGIILTLAGILFPVLASARRAGQRVVCLNNVRQLQVAFTLYLDDHNEQFPSTGNNFLWQGRPWRAVLNDYVSTKSCYWCPVDSTSRLMYDSTSYAYLQTFYHKPTDISAALCGGYYTCTAPAEAQSLGDVTYPASKILIYEWYTNHDTQQQTMWAPVGTHMAVFVDGHAQLLHEEALNLNVLGTRDPNWTVGGVAGKDVE